MLGAEAQCDCYLIVRTTVCGSGVMDNDGASMQYRRDSCHRIVCAHATADSALEPYIKSLDDIAELLSDLLPPRYHVILGIGAQDSLGRLLVHMIQINSYTVLTAICLGERGDGGNSSTFLLSMTFMQRTPSLRT